MTDADHNAKGVERDLSAHFAADERDQLKQLLDRAITTLQDRTNRLPGLRTTSQIAAASRRVAIPAPAATTAEVRAPQHTCDGAGH